MHTLTTRQLGALERFQIERTVGHYTLRCGCGVTIVRLRSLRLLALIDQPADECRNRAHQVDAVLTDAAALAAGR